MRILKSMMAVVALMGSAAAFGAVPGWSVSESSGAVTVSRPGLQPIALRSGALRAGDVVSTGRGGRAVLVRGEEYLVVSPGSRITIADPKPGTMTQIIQSVGNTLFKIKKMATPHFAVETPYMAAVVKGTTFSVTVTATGASVQVNEGRVEVATRDGGVSHMVTPGEIGLVSRNAPYRLTVQGRETITLDSPNKPAGNDTAPARGAAAPSVAVDTAAALDGSIKSGVDEGPVDLGSLSGGLIGGNSSLAVAATNARQFAQRAEQADAPPATGGESNDTAGDNGQAGPGLTRGGNGKVPGGIVGAGAGIGNGNSGSGNGNGNGNSGIGNGNAGGNGNSGGGNGHGHGGVNGNSGGGNGNGHGNGHENGHGNGGKGNGGKGG